MNIERKSIVTIDVSQIKTSKELQLLLKEKLDFPDFYGQNWDAFWDAITGLVELPETVRFVGWTKLQENLRSDSEKMKELLYKLNEEYPTWKSEFLFH